MIVEVTVTCPHCGESFSSNVDTSQGEYTTIEDCTVCCRPMQIRVECAPGEVTALHVDPA